MQTIMLPQLKTKKPSFGLLFLALLSLTVFIFFMISSTVRPYGYFIDEVYFISCAKRLAFGYVDQPPLSIAFLALIQVLLGHSMTVVRILPALSIAATVFVTGLIARRLGGGLSSMLLAGMAVMVMPVLLIFGSLYSMNAYEPLLWTSVAFFSVKMVQEDDPRYWLWIGILFGIGMEMKHTIVLYGIALLFGLLVSDKRRLLFNRWILWGLLFAFLLILPNILWQVVSHFPSLELYRNSFSSKNIIKSYLQVFIEQIIFANPATFPLWITGIIALIFPKGRTYRFMLFAYLFLLGIMMLGHSSRPDRISSIYTFFFAYGAVAIEQYLKKTWRATAQIAIAALMLAGGCILAPVFCPVLPPAALKTHIARLGLHLEIEEGKKGEPIPQWLADRIGWPEMAAEVSLVYHSLTPAEQRNAAIISTNYGEAGALELYGSEYGLPPVFATHNSFHSWGPPSDSIQTYIGVFIDLEDVLPRFNSVEEASVYLCPDCTRPQHRVPVYVMRGPKFSMEKEWPKFKLYH